MNGSTVLLAVSFIALGLAAVLWGHGLVATPSRLAMSLLLLVATGMAILVTFVAASALVRTLWSHGPLVFSLLLGLLALGAVGDFLYGLFGATDTEVHVEEFARPPNDPAPERLRIVSLNVLHGYPEFFGQEERYRRTQDALTALQPDVIILQEAWRTRAHGDMATRLGRDLGLDVTYARANGSLRFLGFEEGSAVLSRYPIVEARRVVLSPRRPWWERRIALESTLALGNERLLVVGTHLTYRSLEVASQQAEFLAARLNGDPVLLAGDFNAGSGSPAVQVFHREGLEDVVPGGIDHVLVSVQGWRVADAGRTLRPEDMVELIGEEVAVSDHPGLLVDLLRE